MARLIVLREYEGIYLDTDVEVVRSFDDLLIQKFFIGYMWDCNLGTAVIGSESQYFILNDLLARYKINGGAEISLNEPNNDIFTRYFIGNIGGFVLDGKKTQLDDALMLNKEALDQPSFLKLSNYSVHHFKQSWKSSGRIKRLLKHIITGGVGLYFYRKYICRKSLKISPFYSEYISTTKNKS